MTNARVVVTGLLGLSLLVSGCAAMKSKPGAASGEIDPQVALTTMRTDIRPDPTGSGFFKRYAISGGAGVQPARY